MISCMAYPTISHLKHDLSGTKQNQINVATRERTGRCNFARLCAVLVMYSDRPQYVSHIISVDNVFTLS